MRPRIVLGGLVSLDLQQLFFTGNSFPAIWPVYPAVGLDSAHPGCTVCMNPRRATYLLVEHTGFIVLESVSCTLKTPRLSSALKYQLFTVLLKSLQGLNTV